MRPIPLALREQISNNPFMSKCAYPSCFSSPEWEHSMTYGNRQINEEWAIIPVCTYHHRDKGLNKNFNRWVAISRATEKDFEKYPKRNWWQEKMALHEQFRVKYDIRKILAIDIYIKGDKM